LPSLQDLHLLVKFYGWPPLSLKSIWIALLTILPDERLDVRVLHGRCRSFQGHRLECFAERDVPLIQVIELIFEHCSSLLVEVGDAAGIQCLWLLALMSRILAISKRGGRLLPTHIGADDFEFVHYVLVLFAVWGCGTLIDGLALLESERLARHITMVRGRKDMLRRVRMIRQ